jgi:hypothetical protein
MYRANEVATTDDGRHGASWDSADFTNTIKKTGED